MTDVSPTEAVTVSAPAPPPAKSHLWVGSNFGFHDLLDAVNPLQHLPIIATIYRAVTGDTIGNVARVVGDGLYGGLVGVASGAIDVATVEATGRDIGQHIVDTLEDLNPFSSSKPAPSAPDAPAAPAAPDGTNPAALVAADPPDPPKLPLLGSPATASALAAAAPISPLLAPKLAAQAQAQAQAQPSSAARTARPLVAAGQPIPIDVSDRGIALMRATSAAHNPRPVALNLPAGSGLMTGGGGGGAAQATAAATAPPDFAERMKDGLAKYDALLAAQARDAKPGTVDQLH